MLLYFATFTLLLRFWEDVRAHAQRAETLLTRVATTQPVTAKYTREAECVLVLKSFFPCKKMGLFSFGALCFFQITIKLIRCALQLRAVLLKIEFSALTATIASRLSLIGAVSSLPFSYRRM
ncbi:hypothetical protein PHMEG_00014666 [Phytophthora megakarya]|uniref:Secreted protein n=1 Tax=Phytophthora megakarya TaxID=4795 RepID=A0A225W3S5_9STRA|nr:hypothetical protein PHMEG_00014666 [Phytophthora megakarya]